MRDRLVPISAALLSCTLAASAHAEVGVLPLVIESVDAERNANLRSSLEVELADVLKRRMVKVVAGRSCGEGLSEKCALEVSGASSAPLDEVALLSVAGTPNGGFVVDISVRETGEGKRVFHETVRQGPTDGPGVVGSALQRAFDPRSWAGRIVVEGAAGDAEVFVDGLRVSGPTVARVGPHRVRVRSADGAERSYQVDVDHGEIATVSVDAPAPAATAPIMPALLLGGVGVAGAGAAAAFGGLAGWYFSGLDDMDNSEDGVLLRRRYEFLSFGARAGSVTIGRDPVDEEWRAGYGTAARGDGTASARLAMRALAHADLAEHESLMTSYTVSAVVTGVVAVAAGVGSFLAWPSAPDESGDADAAPAP